MQASQAAETSAPRQGGGCAPRPQRPSSVRWWARAGTPAGAGFAGPVASRRLRSSSLRSGLLLCKDPHGAPFQPHLSAAPRGSRGAPFPLVLGALGAVRLPSLPCLLGVLHLNFEGRKCCWFPLCGISPSPACQKPWTGRKPILLPHSQWLTATTSLHATLGLAYRGSTSSHGRQGTHSRHDFMMHKKGACIS